MSTDSRYAKWMTRDTRAQLVAAAAKLLDRGGPAAVTLREVGRLAGVSHNAPYKHFASKEELLAAVASRELAQHGDVLRRNERTKKPGDAIRALLQGYVRWALAYPARFKLTFGTWLVADADLGRTAGEARNLLIDAVRAAQEARQLPAGDPERLAALLQALAHGAVDLALSGHLSAKGKGHADADELVDDLLDYLRTIAGGTRDRPRKAHAKLK